MLFDPNFDIDTIHDEMVKKEMMTQEDADKIDSLLDKLDCRDALNAAMWEECAAIKRGVLSAAGR